MSKSIKQILTVTPAATTYMRNLIEKRGKPSMGIRIGIKIRGCTGNAYNLEFADQLFPLEEVIELDSLKIFIDPKAVLYILGTTLDYVEKDFEKGLKFYNPNEKGHCGCGESFYV